MSKGFTYYYALSEPLTPANVPIMNNKWMPVASFALAIGVLEDKIREQFGKSLVYNIAGFQNNNAMIDLERDAKAILTYFWRSTANVESALKLFRTYCIPRKGDVVPDVTLIPAAAAPVAAPAKVHPLAVPTISVAATVSTPSLVPTTKKREREEDEPVKKMLSDHLVVITDLFKQAVDLVRENAIKSMTAVPEFRQRVIKEADKGIEEEKAVKRVAMDAALEAYRVNRKTHMDAALEKEMAAERATHMANMQRAMEMAYNPALAEAVASRVSERSIQGFDVDDFFNSEKK